MQGVMGKIQANDPDSDAHFDVVNMREDGQYKVIHHFTVVCLVAWPLDESEDGVDLVLIETSLLFVSIQRIGMITTSINTTKRERILSKHGQLQRHFHSKARHLRTQQVFFSFQLTCSKISRCHVTSWRPLWWVKTKKRPPYWPTSGDLILFF